MCAGAAPWEPLALLLSTVPAPGPWADLAEHWRAPLEKATISQPAYEQDNSPCSRSPQESWEKESSVQPQHFAEDKHPPSAMHSPRLLRDARWGLPLDRAGSARGRRSLWVLPVLQREVRVSGVDSNQQNMLCFPSRDAPSLWGRTCTVRSRQPCCCGRGLSRAQGALQTWASIGVIGFIR